MPKVGIPGDALSGNTSGIGNYLRELIHHGAFDGFETTVYSRNGSEIGQPNRSTDTVTVSPPRPFGPLPDVLAHAWWENVTTGRVARANGVDLYFAPNYLTPLTYSGDAVVVVHDLIHEVCPQYLPRSYVAYMKALLPRSVRVAARVVTVSESTKADLVREYSIPEAKIDVAYGSASDRFDESTLDEAKKSAIPTGYGLTGDFVLYVGNLEPRKNVHVIIEALEELPSDLRPELAIAGQEFHAYPELNETYSNSPCREHVHFLGYVPDEDLPYLYAGAEAFVLPSLYEGFGLPVVESMKTGTPVVTSDRASLPEVVGDAGITVDPTSPTAVANGLETLLSSSSYDWWVDRALDRAVVFSWDDSAQTVNDAVSEVLT